MILTHVLLTLLLFASGAAGDAEALYRSGRYAEALAEFETAIRSSSNPSAALLYDAGNCAYRLSLFPKAALYYRRASLRAPQDPKVRFNLQLTQQKLGMAPEPDSFLKSLTQAARQVPLSRVLALAAALEASGLVLLIVFRRRKGVILTAALLLAGAAGAGALYADRAFGNPASLGMVLAAEVKVYAEPREDLPFTVKLKVGEVVEIEEASDRWMRIRYGERSGWTPREGIGEVN